MDNELTIRKTLVEGTAKRSAAAAVGIAMAVLLPQLFHIAGIAIGAGSLPGEVYLPMHIPVFLTGLMAGPAAGIAAGAIGPLASSMITGMPAQAMLPFMMIELAVYGIVSGCLGKYFVHGESVKSVLTRSLFAVLVTQIAGRAVKAAAIMAAFGAFDMRAVGPESIPVSISRGMPGIVLQLVVIPVIMAFCWGLAAKNNGRK